MLTAQQKPEPLWKKKALWKNKNKNKKQEKKGRRAEEVCFMCIIFGDHHENVSLILSLVDNTIHYLNYGLPVIFYTKLTFPQQKINF